MTPSEFAWIRDLLAGLSGEIRQVHVRLDRLESVQLDFQGLVARHALGGRMDALDGRMERIEARLGEAA